MKPSRVDLLSALTAAQDPTRTIDSTFWVERILARELESQRFLWAYDLRFLVGALVFAAGFLGGVFLVKTLAACP